jgi:hypothetical protein
MRMFRNFLSGYVLKCKLSYNLVINDFIAVLPAAADGDRCSACQL